MSRPRTLTAWQGDIAPLIEYFVAPGEGGLRNLLLDGICPACRGQVNTSFEVRADRRVYVINCWNCYAKSTLMILHSEAADLGELTRRIVQWGREFCEKVLDKHQYSRRLIDRIHDDLKEVKNGSA